LRIRSSFAHVLVTASIMAAVASQAATPGTLGGSRLWPLSIKINLSSSFGEYREGHIHAGLDIRTFGRRGIPARAVEDGSIVRIHASSRGYGKALYLRLQSGETAVYAHLSEFAPPLEEYLYRKQLEAGRYEVDLYPPTGSFTVRAGEVIGYTGSTGTSAPHLHFEVRDVRGRPVNPLSRGWKVEDRMAPVIRAVAWIPLERCSRVDGEENEVVVELEESGRNSFIASDTLVLEGTCGLGALIVDRTDRSSGILAPYVIELSVDGRMIARVVRDRFSYEESGEVDLEYEMGRLREEGRQFFLLFRRRGETLPGRTFVAGGRISAADSSLLRGGEGEIHEAMIRATDRNGNTSVAVVPFKLGCGREGGNVGKRGTRNTGSPGGLFAFEDIMTMPVESLADDSRRFLRALSLGSGEPDCICGNRRVVLTASDLGGEPVDVIFGRNGPGRRMRVFPVREGVAVSCIDPGLGVEIRAGASALYAGGILYLAGCDAPRGSAGPRELEPVSRTFQVGPSSAAFKDGIEIRLGTLERIEPGAAVYRWNDKKKTWEYCESTLAGDTLVCRTKVPGAFRAFIDAVPPRIETPSVIGHRMYATGEIFPEVVFPLEDGGSGVNGEDTEVYMDGTKMIARWDYFSKKMFVLVREKNIIGDHELVIIARDNSGNVSRLQTTINISPKGKAASRGSEKNAQ